MKKYYFEKKKFDDGIHVFATRDGWTNEYTPDGEVDTSIEFTAGEKITQEEAEKILNEYDWEICSECGNIFPGGGDCEDCLYQDYKKEEDKMLKEKNGMYAISDTEYISDDGEWEVSTKTGKPMVYHLGEYTDMDRVDVPDFVQELYDELK